MKFIKYIFATIAVSCLFTTSVFAANLSTDYKYTFSLDATPTTLEAGDKVTVSVYLSAKDASNNDIDTIVIPDENAAYVSIGLNYNSDVLSIEKNRDCIKTDTYMSNPHVRATLNQGNVTFGNAGLLGMDIGEITPSTALLKFIFTVKDGVSTATYDSSNPLFSLNDQTTFVKDTANTPAVGTFTTNSTFASTPTINVVGAAPAGPSVSAGTVVDNVTEYTFENSTAMEGKKVLVTTAATARTAIGEDTRFYVSYQGAEPRIFGSDVWGKLAQGGGTITVNNIKFGIIVSEGLNASDFTFEVK